MRIHELEVTGIGPYAGTEKIDFTGLNEAGVLLLSGPTGSGKTTVLDAVCFALYGEVPRANKGIELVSDHRDPEKAAPPGVELDFTVAGSRFRVTRRPAFMRPKKRGKGEFTEEKQFVRLERFAGGQWSEEATGWSEANNRLSGLIGMDADQFHQLVLLPQGRFARFLESNVNERKELLETLFPGNDLTYVEEWLKRQARQDEDSRNAKLAEISDCLEQARPVFDNFSAELEEEGLDPLPDLPDHNESEPVAAWVAQVSARLEARASAAETARSKSQRLCSQAEKALAEAQKKEELIAQRATAEDRVEELEAKAGWRGQLDTRIDAADRATGVVPMVRESRKARGDAETLNERAGELATHLAAPEAAGSDDPDELRKTRTSFEKEIASISNFEGEGQPRRRVVSARLDEARGELKELRGGSPESDLSKAESALASATAARTAARERLIEVRTRRTAGMAAELASQLVDGAPCPVCGSTTHPGADHSDSPPVSEKEEAEAAERDSVSESALSDAVKARDAAEAEARNRISKLGEEIERLAKEFAELTGKEEELAAGEATPAARREKLETLNEQISSFLDLRQRASDALRTAEEAGKSAEEEAGKRGFGDTTEAEAAWIEPEELAGLRRDAAAHDAELNKAKGLLEGTLRDVDRNEQVDLEPLERARDEAVGLRDRDVALLSVATERLATFGNVTGKIPGLFEELIPLREAAARSSNLHRLASGDNERRMKLSTYVLAVRLRQVIQAANRHLRLMSNDRYELVYSGDVAAHGATSGLGIRVFDSHTSDTRSTGTLSGGESFYASLSLALGLAEVVQHESGGKPLETLFIDEGFGTLDSRTLDQVMDVIDDLRAGGRTVGLVSHVDELKSRVSARIEVTATKAGSTIDVVGV